LMEVRSDAIACLALPDVRLLKEYEAFPEDEAFPVDLPMAFTPDLECYTRSDIKGNVSVRRVEDNAELARVPPNGAYPPGTNPFLRFSTDGKLLALRHIKSPGKAGNLQVWDWKRGKLLFQSPESFPLGCVDFSPDSRQVALGYPNGTLTVHDANTGTKLFGPTDLGMTPHVLAYHPDGTKLAVVNTGSGQVQVREVATGNLVRKWSTPGALRWLAWHPGGVLLATGHDDLCVHLWDTSSGQERG